MKIIRLILTITVLPVVLSSCIKKHNDRNSLVFKDRIESVQDSLIKMEIILSKLPKRNDNKNTNYYIEDNKLYISDSLIDKSFIRSGLYSKIYTQKQKNDFIRLSEYLNKNFLSSAYFDEADKLWRFIYKDFPDKTFHDTRDICILNFSETLSLPNDTVLDHKEKIYLLAPKDAEIR